MKTIDGYLSGFAQSFWPDAIVYIELASGPGGPMFFYVERKNEEPIGLGPTFKHAKLAIQALKRREESK